MTSTSIDNRVYSTDMISAGTSSWRRTTASLPDLSVAARLARLKKFRFRAVIDYIELEINSTWSTQARHLQSRMPSEWGSHITEVDSSSGTFIIRVNDPPADVAKIRSSLKSAGVDMGKPIPVRSMEISLDAHPAQVFSELEAVELAYETAATFGNSLSNLRTVTSTHDGADTKIRPTSAELLEHFRLGATCYNGNKWNKIAFRTYIKRTDRGQPLPITDFRVRHEATIKDPAMLPRTLDELALFRFESLTPLFPVYKEQLTDIGPRSTRAEIRRRLTELCPQLVQRWPATKGRVKSRQLRNFPRIQEQRVYEPLRRLGHRIDDSERP